MATEAPSREKLLARVHEAPGDTTRRLAAAIGMSESGAAYHLRRLERVGAVRSEPIGRERCWFPPRGGYCPVLRRAVPLLRRPPMARVALALEPTPRSVPEVAERAGVAVGSARWAAGSLERAFLVARTRSGRAGLREGADVCLERALAAQPCPLWGECAVSRAWIEAREALLAPTSRSPSATGSSRDRSSGPRRAPSSG